MARLLNLLANLRRSYADSEDFLLPGAPRYVAVIMDGNGRWAARRRLPAIAGHREGARALKRIVAAARRMEIRELSVYAFSTENWRRPAEEVGALMSLFAELIRKEVPELNERGVRVRFIGRREGLSQELTGQMDWAQELTAASSDMTLYVAFNYGGRAEIEDALLSAMKNRSAQGDATAIEDAASKDAADAFDLRKYLYAPEMHDPELLIRTSGEQRLSNFLLWQCAYSELYFSDKLWPDFGEDDLRLALEDFGNRQRRFGAR